MSAFVVSRRSMLEAAALGAGALVVAGFPVASVAAHAQSAANAPSAMLAAWVVVQPEAGADVRFAYLDARGRPLRELPAVRLQARLTAPGGKPASAWRQAQEAAVVAQSLAAAMAAGAWGARASECEIRPGRIVHPASGRSIRHCVWLEVA